MNPLHPKKLLLTKWTAVQPIARQKHFVVTKVLDPETLDATGEDAATESANPSRCGLESGPKAAGKPRKAPHSAKIEWIEIEAVYSGKVRRIAWRDLRDTNQWRQGWI